MTRMRGVKPDLLRHEGLLDLEASTSLPIRLAFIGLLMCADRCGRFQWRPRTLKAECLPHDVMDFAAVLTALAGGDFVRRYTIEGKEYGWIPGFTTHQRLNPREAKSNFPAHPDEQLHCNYTAIADTGEYNSADASEQPQLPEDVIPVGKERKGRGKEEEGKGSAQRADTPPPDAEAVFRFCQSAGMPWTKAHAAFWFDHMEERGWMQGEQGTIPVRNWQASARKATSWVIDAVARNSNSAPSGTGETPKKNKAAPEAQDGAIAIFRERHPDFRGTFADMPFPERKSCLAAWQERQKKGGAAA